ncbi:O-antigen ligase family protein [Erythrobacter dokdonensis]|uniref:O-antigen polymerase n=1 Tax=Erythrobacter dokdonensis DSW-74 TaxID=1300349 RepID=A0A1A7BHK0_9SPHN|nr:O-antigen ligase family protein [Erythrobacter dokdonensis]OBV11191.1 O-antigen polymerase [Erythrobacter dokdonensis DSW-74]
MDKSLAQRIPFFTIAAVLLVAFALGGGGSRQGLANLLVQLTAVAALVPHRAAVLQFWRTSPLPLRMLIGLSLLLPLLQIIPLPAAMWTALPGRELVARSLEMTDGNGWQAMSVNPLRTALAVTALVTPLTVLAIGWSLPRDRLITLGWMAAGLGLVTVLFGLAQLGAASDSGTLFGARSPGKVLLGTFANRNSTGLLLGFALALAALLPAPRPHPAVPLVRAVLCALLVLAIILTKSRTAMALAAIPLGLAGIKALWWALRERRAAAAKGGQRPLAIVIGALALLALGGTGLVVAAPGRIGEAFERFEARDDPRRYIWDDATYAATRYWPVGAGTGTFDEVFQVDESLENLTQRTAGRAHNDYLELAIESGLAGLVLAAFWIVLVGWLSWRARLSSQRWAAWAGSSFLLAIALQSITDYPLRNQTVLAFAGFALLLLARIASDQRKVPA